MQERSNPRDVQQLAAALVAAQKRLPDYRIGQIVSNAVGDADVFYVEDGDLVTRILAYPLVPAEGAAACSPRPETKSEALSGNESERFSGCVEARERLVALADVLKSLEQLYDDAGLRQTKRVLRTAIDVLRFEFGVADAEGGALPAVSGLGGPSGLGIEREAAFRGKIAGLTVQRDELRGALKVAADDLDKAANQFASMRESQKAGHYPAVVGNPEKFADKADRARAVAGNEVDGSSGVGGNDEVGRPASPPGNGRAWVKGTCPACCRIECLFVGDGGYLTCSSSDCPDPAAPHKYIAASGSPPNPKGEALKNAGSAVPEEDREGAPTQFKGIHEAKRQHEWLLSFPDEIVVHADGGQRVYVKGEGQ